MSLGFLTHPWDPLMGRLDEPIPAEDRQRAHELAATLSRRELGRRVGRRVLSPYVPALGVVVLLPLLLVAMRIADGFGLNPAVGAAIIGPAFLLVLARISLRTWQIPSRAAVRMLGYDLCVRCGQRIHSDDATATCPECGQSHAMLPLGETWGIVDDTRR